MNEQWRDFLIDLGAEFEQSRLLHFGNPENERRVINNGLVVSDLSQFCLVTVSGKDQYAFLQGQLTNDIEKVTDHHSQLSGYCNQKGRLLASFRIFKHKDNLVLKLPRELHESTFKRLQMYVMRSDVKFAPCSDDLTGIGFSGPGADSELSKHFTDIPSDTDNVTQINEVTIIRIAGPHPRFEIYATPEKLKNLWQKLDVNAAAIGPEAWQLLDIHAGQPTIYEQTVEAFVPQMVNLELINGVSFKKGCYTGQEIVARMHYLGKLKRRMYLIHINSNEPVVPGAALYCPDSTSGQGTGNIVLASLASDSGTDALAVIQISNATSQGLRLYDENGPEITLSEQPYSFPPEKQ